MFYWTRDIIRFRIDAAHYGGFDDKIAARILPHLPQNAHVCDAGCGLGYLSLALAPHCARVTAVDASAEALEVLRENAHRAGAENLSIIEGDLFSMRPARKYDAMVFCFFGGMNAALRAIKAQCASKAFLIKKHWDTHRFALEEKPLAHYTFQRACAELDALGVPYQAEVFPLEMGQPLRSVEDAALFFSTYNEESIPNETERARIAGRLVSTGDAQFPYYLPACRPLGMIVLNAGDIPDFIENDASEE